MSISIRNFSNQELIQATERAVVREREATGVVLEHLREIDRRRLFAELGFSSLFAYCTEALKYCPASAQLRIDAMRLLKDVPEVKEKIDQGTLSLTNAATLQRFFRNEKKENGRVYEVEEKRELLARAEGQTRDQTERMLAEISPAALPREKRRVLTPTMTELKLVAGERLMTLIEELKMLMNDPGPSDARVLEYALEIALRYKKLPVRRRVQVQVARGDATSASENPSSFKVARRSFAREVRAASKVRPYIPVKKLREVVKKASGRCSFVSSLNGRRCGSSKVPQFEHIQPFAKGGPDEVENLTLLCPAHQRLRAIEEFGMRKMDRYLGETESRELGGISVGG